MKEAQGPSGILVVNRRFAQAEVVTYAQTFLPCLWPQSWVIRGKEEDCGVNGTLFFESNSKFWKVFEFHCVQGIGWEQHHWGFWTTVPPADRGKAQLSHPRKGRGRLSFRANCPHLLFKKCCFSLDGTLEIKSTTVDILCPWVDSNTVLTNETSKWSNIELTLCRALLWSAEAVLLILTRTLCCMLSSSGLSPLIWG